jgi:hypothetical protein
MKKIATITLLTVMAGFAAIPKSMAAADMPATVVELFTSQGCSSCPPADRLLADLAGRDDVIAIAYHVTYWDYIGWKDPFATEWGTQRQYAYARVLGRGYPYTPQMVIDGRHDVVGSRRGQVANLLVQSMHESDSRIPVALRREGDNLVISLPATKLAQPLDLWMVRYSGPHETRVLRGENRGATLVDTHIAQQMRLLGSWSGDALETRTDLPLSEKADGGVAVWIQEKGTGAIVGAGKLELDPDA